MGGHFLDKSLVFVLAWGEVRGVRGSISRLVRAGMSRADEMLVSGVGDC